MNKYLTEQTNLEDHDRIRFLRKIAQCSMRLADIENRKENFSEALKEYSDSIEILKAIEDVKRSRRIAQLYYLIGNTYLYEFATDALKNAKDVLLKGEEIIHTLLEEEKSKTEKNEKKIKEFKDLIKVFSSKISDISEEMNMNGNIDLEKARILEITQKSNEFPKSQFGSEVEVKKLGKFSKLKKSEPDLEITREADKKVNPNSTESKDSKDKLNN